MSGEQPSSIGRQLVETVIACVSVPVTLIVMEQLHDETSRLRLAIAQARDELGRARHLLDEAWIRYTVNRMTGGHES